jgi:hypothetical protein
MKTMLSTLMALSVLAGAAMSAAAQTRQDEERGDYWQQQEDRLP